MNSIENIRIIAEVNSKNYYDEDVLKELNAKIYETMLKSIELRRPVSEQDLKLVVLYLAKIISTDKGHNLDVGFINVTKQKEIARYSNNKILFNIFDGNLNNCVLFKNLLSPKQIDETDDIKEYIKQIVKVRQGLIKNWAMIIETIVHEIRHKEQEELIEDKTKWNATTLLMAKEQVLLSSNLYERNHDDFLIEKDAIWAGIVLAPIYFKKFYPNLKDDEYNILDPKGNKKKKLAQSISEHKNTVWQIIESFVKDNQQYITQDRCIVLDEDFGFSKIDILLGKNLSNILDKNEIERTLQRYPQLKLIYDDNGVKKDYLSICKDRKYALLQVKDKVEENKIKILYEAIVNSDIELKIVGKFAKLQYMNVLHPEQIEEQNGLFYQIIGLIENLQDFQRERVSNAIIKFYEENSGISIESPLAIKDVDVNKNNINGLTNFFGNLFQSEEPNK